MGRSTTPMHEAWPQSRYIHRLFHCNLQAQLRLIVDDEQEDVYHEEQQRMTDAYRRGEHPIGMRGVEIIGWRVMASNLSVPILPESAEHAARMAIQRDPRNWMEF